MSRLSIAMDIDQWYIIYFQISVLSYFFPVDKTTGGGGTNHSIYIEYVQIYMNTG